MYKVWWKTSGGAMIPAGVYNDKEAALADARETICVLPEPVTTVVTDKEGAVIFSTANDDA
jgi:hypothetical protein